MDNTQKNICEIYKNLFELKKKQKIEEGEQGEILEYTRAKYSVILPQSKIVLPRHKTIPKQKPLTKWEKFRLEKGLPPKAKRSRYVYDPVSKDWLPRFGMGSIKKVQDKFEWAMEEKAKHVEAGIDPFTYKKNEKKIQKEM